MSNKRVSGLSFIQELKVSDNLLVEHNNITSTAELSVISKELAKEISVDISKILPSGAVAGQVLTFNGTSWIPA
jgi:hypothetical protein